MCTLIISQFDVEIMESQRRLIYSNECKPIFIYFWLILCIGKTNNYMNVGSEASFMVWQNSHKNQVRRNKLGR